MNDDARFGRHGIIFEEGKLAHIFFRGKVSEDEVDGLRDLHESRWGPAANVRLMINITEQDGLTPGARKRIATQQQGIAAVGIYGGAFAQRIVANLMIRAVAVVKEGAPTKLFGDVEDARKWLDGYGMGSAAK